MSASTSPRPHRGTLFCVEGEILGQVAWPGDQHVLRVKAPAVAAAATPGSFVHLQCSPAIPMRRPLSLYRANRAEGWFEVLYKVHGPGLAALARREPGSLLSVLGPIGRGFRPDPERPRAVLLGGGVGVPPLVFLAETLVGAHPGQQPIAFFGSEIPFPFPVGTAGSGPAGIPAGASASMTALESLGVPSRLASGAGIPGCYRGFVTSLAREWIGAADPSERARMTLYACGPGPMLKAAQALAREFGLPSQLCLEEYMACAVGGCAGCVVPVQVDGRRQMKRVCVDGPVFDGATVCSYF